VIERYRGHDIPRFFRGDAAFADPKLQPLLERKGFRHLAHNGAPLFPVSALQSLACGGSLV
jgi:hypothetical protein